MTLPEITAHLARVVAGFAPLVDQRLIAFSEAADAIDRFLWTDPRCAGLPDDTIWRLSENAHADIIAAINHPIMAASSQIRAAIIPMIAARKPRAELIITAYRAANGRLSASDVEHIVQDEIASFMARVRANPAANDRQKSATRNAG